MKERYVSGILMKYMSLTILYLRDHIMFVDSAHVALQLGPKDIAVLN